MVILGREILVKRLALAVLALYFLTSPAAAVTTVVALGVAYLATQKLRAVARARRLALAAAAVVEPLPALGPVEPEPPEGEIDWDYLRDTPACKRQGKGWTRPK